METILRSVAWKIIDSGELFDIGFVTADRRRGTGGDYKELKGYRKVMKEQVSEHLPGKVHTPKRDLRKDPQHSVHKTFNICNPNNPNIHMHKVHYRLFDRFNGKTVLQ
jgi:hypothetical protein